MTTTHRYKAAVIIPSRGGADILHYPLDALAAQTEKGLPGYRGPRRRY